MNSCMLGSATKRQIRYLV